MTIKPIDDILQDLSDMKTTLDDTWVSGNILTQTSLNTLTTGLLNILTDLATATSNEVDTIIRSGGINGLHINRLKAGCVYKYWVGGVAGTGGFTIPANGKLYIATVAEFPYLAYYQAEPIYKEIKVISPAGVAFAATCVMAIDNTGIYFVGQGTSQLIGAGNTVTFDETLVLDPTIGG